MRVECTKRVDINLAQSVNTQHCPVSSHQEKLMAGQPGDCALVVVIKSDAMR